ncbi:hypothetical protein [uncultured Erythrobacter sp.]|uniref:hypothetical protein n=1 Tax=uncultured Erythrobacter sp. TaxID=263913 RepID=UPI002625DD27|nr:hypothetical protein [uncultured Erythrobacter sp.]
MIGNSLNYTFKMVLASGAALTLQGCVATATPVTASDSPGEREISGHTGSAPRAADVPTSEVVRPLPKPVPSVREPIAPSGINQFLSYANQWQNDPEEAPDAAVLSDRVSLQPTKAKCSAVSPTILIDLDPQGELFDPSNASRPPSGLAQGLSRLRQNGVSVAWISGHGIGEIEIINRSLALSGLDIGNEDRILLLRSPNDRKQILREELAQISCLVAIAGDTRSDFDELYDFLKQPADADALEPLIGDGWFLIPQPLL